MSEGCWLPDQRRVGGTTGTMGCSGEPAPLRAGQELCSPGQQLPLSPSLCPWLKPCGKAATLCKSAGEARGPPSCLLHGKVRCGYPMVPSTS